MTKYAHGKHPNSLANLQKGRKGRAKGSTNRPKSDAAAVTAAAQVETLDMLQVLVGIAKDPTADAGARIRAAGMVLDRGCGRPRSGDDPAEDPRYRPSWQGDLDIADMKRAIHGDAPQTSQGQSLAYRFGLVDEAGQPIPPDDDDLPQA